MKAPIETSKVLDRGGNPTVRELLSSIVFNPSNGMISLNGDRIVMQRTAVSTELRRELIRLLGPQETRVFLMRLGFLSGQSDARFVRASWPNLDARDAFTAGTRLHTFSGVVRVETVFNTYDFRKKKLTAEFLWHDSVEAAEFRRNRPSPDPVCWTQLGYASGYASEFFDTLIVYKEVECAGQGHHHCRVVGKHAEAWGAGDPEVALFRDRILVSTDPLPAELLRKAGADRSLSDLDRLLLLPVRAQLDRMASMAMPVLIRGALGTGRGRAAQHLHQASGVQAAELRRIVGSQVDPQLCVEIARAGKPGKRGPRRDTILIDGVDDVPAAIQLQLARSIEDGILNAGPRVIATADESRLACASGLSPELYSALSGLTVRLPCFSERTGQLGDIANTLLPILAVRMGVQLAGLDAGAVKYIEGHPWPGNLNQMRSVLTAVLAARSSGDPISAGEIATQHASIAVPPPATGKVESADTPLADLIGSVMEAQAFDLPDFEQSIYRAAIERAGGNLSAAARVLGLTRAQLAYRVNVKSDPGQDSDHG